MFLVPSIFLKMAYRPVCINFSRMAANQTESPPQSAGRVTENLNEFRQQIQVKRESFKDLKFNMKRVRVLNNVGEVSRGSKAIAYWMARDQRVQDNWALIYAQNLAIKNKFPLHVIFCLTDKFMNSPLRHYKFMLDGLKEVSEDLDDLDINFHLLRGSHTIQIPKFVKDFSIGCLVCDFSPLRIHREWIDGITKNIPKNIPFIQVDAHNVVPLWVASDKLEYAAYTIRSKINTKLDEFLTEFPAVIKHPHKTEKLPKINWEEALDSVNPDASVGEVNWIKPGYRGATDVLEDFIKNRLKNYDEHRNNPNNPAISNLSPYFHFGHIAPQRAVLEVKRHRDKFPKSVDSFCEQSTVRRELADNFCYYNKNYDNLKSIDEWAMQTLDEHRKDKREYIYTLKEFDEAQTHDHLWNASQNQMKIEGKMNCYMRMYWCKKIFEWTNSPEEALEIAIYLNDRYNIDGRDPNGYNGIMWCIAGIHDRPFAARQVYGKIRYMSYFGCTKKFDVPGFIRKYNGDKVGK